MVMTTVTTASTTSPATVMPYIIAKWISGWVVWRPATVSLPVEFKFQSANCLNIYSYDLLAGRVPLPIEEMLTVPPFIFLVGIDFSLEKLLHDVWISALQPLESTNCLS